MEKEFNYDNVEETQDQDALKIIQNMQDGDNNYEADEDESNKDVDTQENDDNDDDSVEQNKLFANKYKTVDELKKGIKNIGSTLPDYIIDGMNDSALEKHYLDLQKEFSSKDRKFKKDNVEKPNEKPNEENKQDNSENKDETKNISADLFNEAEEYFVNNGGLSDELYDKLEKAGIPSSIVDRHIAMVQQEAINFTREVYSLAGGEEEYKKIQEWAESGGVDADELDYISGIKDKTKLIGALKNVKARYDLANGNTQRLNGNVNTSNANTGSYRSESEYLADVSNPKYNLDENFRNKVDKKLANSKFK